jgi:predicted nucleotidyltransferase component of viral defense system
MRLHENQQLFDQAIRATAQHKQLREVYIEKDYWVTFALHTIFNSDIGGETVFKGGTALSKCFGLIERFSEDIDLVVLRKEGESGNRLTNKIKAISKVVSAVMPEVQVEGITQKMGMNRKTGHSYPKVFKGDLGQVRDVVIVEATWLGNFEPYTETSISTFIYEMMVATDQQKLAKEYGLLPFGIKVLDSQRTICEKIMSLVRFSYSENPVEDLRNKVRHIYDLTQLLKTKDLMTFFDSEGFEKMLLKVAQDDVPSYRNNNAWLAHHPLESPLFSDLENIWNQIKSTYSEDFSQLVYGKLPSEKEVLATLKMIAERMKSIAWTVKLS